MKNLFILGLIVLIISCASSDHFYSMEPYIKDIKAQEKIVTDISEKLNNTKDKIKIKKLKLSLKVAEEKLERLQNDANMASVRIQQDQKNDAFKKDTRNNQGNFTDHLDNDFKNGN